MSTVAEQLRAAREAKNLTVEQVAETTKIRTDHIRALEEGNFNVFSAQIYIRGSVKNYSSMLKLDTPALLAALDAELDQTEKYSEPPPLVEPENTLVDRFTLLLAKVNWKMSFAVLAGIGAIVVLVISIWAWRHRHHGDSLKNLPPAVYQPGNSGDTLPLPKR
ncbi:MAG TPA: helix-turn-helix domain-containing protein [Candidatus Binatia bacterium]|nr:helix-turn-helix domain-containing protein [Candidatus Binatia bacterium]